MRQLFLHFRGPVNILIQSRGSTLNEVLTTRDVNEIADTPAGVVSAATILPTTKVAPAVTSAATPTSMSFAEVKRDGKVQFEESKPSPQS